MKLDGLNMKCKRCGQEFNCLKQINLFLLYHEEEAHFGWCGECSEKEYKGRPLSTNSLRIIFACIAGAIFFFWLLFYFGFD